jgi:cell division protein FtsI (penicillin-binding protein 3)
LFKEVANYIYANSISLKSNLIADTLKTKAPAVTGPLWYADIEKINEFLSIPTTVYGDKSNWVFPDYQDDDCSYSPYNVKYGIMPQTRGMMAKDAVFLLEDMGLKVSVNGRGKVVAQSIKPGKHVKKGNHVTLRLGNW